MLLLTETAAEVVKSVTSTPQAEDGGLRIAASAEAPENPGELQLSAEPQPSDNDQVIEAAGARVFLEPNAATYLQDKVLDAKVDEEGNAQFSLAVQRAE